jgi:hypothetical protein
MLLAAFRRLLVLLVLAAAVTTPLAILFGLLAGASVERAVSVGFYGVGSFLLLAGFFVGNRGPARLKEESAGVGSAFLPLFGSRRLRWATRDEHEETINTSAIFVTLGFVLLVLGVIVDDRYRLL